MISRKIMACLSPLCVGAMLLGAVPAVAQSLEGVKRPDGEPKPDGYMAKDSVDYRLLLGPPPTPGSLLDQIDMAVSQRLQAGADAERWQVGQLDSKMVYPRFADAFGRPIDRLNSPRLVHLLNRAMRDAADPVWTAKELFQRPRPYQRYQLTRRCGSKPVPAPENEPRGGSSYPSGHSVYGWATALILAEVAPDRAPLILDRGRDYALSRVICGYHFPTDTEAARTVAAAVIVRLHNDTAFRADLQAAQAEYGTARSPHNQLAPTKPVAPATSAEAQAD